VALLCAVLTAVVVLGGAALTAERVEACAFTPRVPQTYEAEQSRATYLAAIDAASVNALFPGDAFFGVPPVELGGRSGRSSGPSFVPAVLLKAIAWVESDLTMASRSVRFQSIGDALVSFDCGHGVMQITTGMTIPLGAEGRPSDRQVSTATHYAWNIARGAAMLADKWNQAPELRPVAGTDTNANPALVENWYFATWSYNGFTGPGASQSNHPLDPSKGWPRPAFRCDGTQSRNRYPYQELVWGCMANPPSRNGQLLWRPVAASLPNLTMPQFAGPLSISRWQYPYSAMDIPTPQPANVAQPPAVAPDYRQQALGAPSLEVSTTSVTIRTNGLPHEATARVRIHNAGTGILSWQATSAQNFLVLSPPGGVALGPGITCTSVSCPDAELVITVNPTLLPKANTSATITLASPNSSRPPVTVRVAVTADFEVGVPGTSRQR
jgi:hypothetical protein